jgi:hypothetical protein
MLDEVLASMLLTGLTVFLILQVRRRRLQLGQWGQKQMMAAASVLSLSFISFLCVMNLAAELGTGPGAAVPSNFLDPLQGARSPVQWQDRLAGYQAGYALAMDPQHRGSKLPKPLALDVMIGVRCHEHSADFQVGFKLGYVAGLLCAIARPTA